MAQSTSFTDKERAARHNEHREEVRNGSKVGLEFDRGSTCIHCGIWITEGTLCEACE